MSEYYEHQKFVFEVSNEILRELFHLLIPIDNYEVFLCELGKHFSETTKITRNV